MKSEVECGGGNTADNNVVYNISSSEIIYFCPLTKTDCLKNKCAWYAKTQYFDGCSMKVIAKAMVR